VLLQYPLAPLSSCAMCFMPSALFVEYLRYRQISCLASCAQSQCLASRAQSQCLASRAQSQCLASRAQSQCLASRAQSAAASCCVCLQLGAESARAIMQSATGPSRYLDFYFVLMTCVCSCVPCGCPPPKTSMCVVLWYVCVCAYCSDAYNKMSVYNACSVPCMQYALIPQCVHLHLCTYMHIQQ